MLGLYVCIVLSAVCVLVGWQTAYRLKKLQAVLDALESQKEILGQQLGEFGGFYLGLKAEEKQLTAQCRKLSQELTHLRLSIEELEEADKKIEEHRPGDPI